MERRIQLDNNWTVEIEQDKWGYTIKKVFAHFGHGVWLPIATDKLIEAEWEIIHTALEVSKK